MSRKNLIAVLALAIAMPFAIARADDSVATTTSDCGTAPTMPAAGSTQDQLAQFRQDRQTYMQCARKNNQDNRQTLRGDKQQLTQDRCTLINQRISDRLNNFQNKQNGDSTIFDNTYKRLVNIQTRLKNASLDTTKLEGDLATLKTKIDKVSTDYASFIAGLKDTENFTCGQSQGQFMGKLGGARGILLSVRQDRLDVRSYITNTIIPDIKALRQQLQKKEGATDTTADTSVSATK